MIYAFEKLDSTNQYALDHLRTLKDGDVILASVQSAGRGRHGHRWQAAKNSSLLASFIIKKNLSYDRLIHLSSYAGYVLTMWLRDRGVPALIKYPNDIYVNDRKLAGILVETNADGAVVGIGLNLTSAPLSTSIALNEILVGRLEPQVIAAQLTVLMENYWPLFSQLDQLYGAINRYGYLNGKEMTTSRFGRMQILSIDAKGQIHYKQNGQEHVLFVHELSSH